MVAFAEGIADDDSEQPVLDFTYFGSINPDINALYAEILEAGFVLMNDPIKSKLFMVRFQELFERGEEIPPSWYDYEKAVRNTCSG